MKRQEAERAKPTKEDAVVSLKSSGSAQPTRAKSTEEDAPNPMSDRPPNAEKKRDSPPNVAVAF